MKEEHTQTEEISNEELDALDASLLEIDLLYKSRCVKASGNNVTVREIERPEE